MADHILVFNCGSSSLNYKLYASDGNHLIEVAFGKAHHLATKSQTPGFIEHRVGEDKIKLFLTLESHKQAASIILDYLMENNLKVDAIGHRFVHGGTEFLKSTKVTPENLIRLQKLHHLAPIHNPNSYSVIDLCLDRFPDVVQYMCFDTSFHASLPEKAFRYAIPYQLSREKNFRKFGFHGLSYQYICQKVSTFLEKPIQEIKMIACHLGTGGSSVAAILGGKSIETSMGYSPLAGLVMSTRCGDLDVSVVLEMIERYGYSAADVTKILNKESGLVGISGLSSDIRELIQVSENHDRSALAVSIYTLRLKEYIGAYMAVLGGLDVLVFTDDIGVQSWQIRQEACRDMDWSGIQLDDSKNQQAQFDQVQVISSESSRVVVLSIPTDEEQVIAQEGSFILESARRHIRE
jgi:acetate kinase